MLASKPSEEYRTPDDPGYVVDSVSRSKVSRALVRSWYSSLDIGYIARLEEGFRIVYVGPLEDSGVAILGS